MLIKITSLTIDPNIQLQSRSIDESTVASYVEAISGGAEFPPVVVFDDGTIKWLAGGFHRFEAHRFLGLAEIEADVRLGTHEDAMIFAAVDNVLHGRPMSQAQKREAGERLLRMTDWSDREIARRLAVGNKTVSRWRSDLSVSDDTDTTRTVTRGGTTYAMDVQNIGKREWHPPTEKELEERAEFLRRFERDNIELGVNPLDLPRENQRPHVSHNSGNNEWYTPAKYIEAVREVLGNIDLDPASTLEANAVVGADKIYTVQDDGLQMPWCGRVFMNPPYSSDLIPRFATKFRQHVLAGDITEAVVLVNNATETGWFQSMATIAQAICFPSSRIRFWGPNGEIGSPLQGQAILYFGSDEEKFYESFSKFGIILWRR